MWHPSTLLYSSTAYSSHVGTFFRFSVSLHCRSADFVGNVDIPLHISVRYDDGKMVFNTCAKGEWGKEEKKSNPLKRGEAFDLRIRAHDHQFQVGPALVAMVSCHRNHRVSDHARPER